VFKKIKASIVSVVSTFTIIVTLMPKLVVYIICIRIQFFGLWLATISTTGKWFCTRTLTEKCKYTDRNQIINSNEGWTVILEIIFIKLLN